MGIANLLLRAIEERKRSYSTSLEEDENLAFSANPQSLTLNHTNAVMVRLTEKRILAENERMLQIVMEAISLKRKQDQQSDNNSINRNKKSKKS